MRYTIKLILCLISCFILLFYYSKGNYPIHIFFENVGTTPELGGLLEYVQLPRRDIKIIAWHRIKPNLSKEEQKNNNTILFELPKIEGQYSKTEANFLSFLKKELKKYPNKSIIIYTGLDHMNFSVKIAKEFPQNPISHIHFYEDGVFNLASGFTSRYQIESAQANAEQIKILKDYIQGKNNYQPHPILIADIFPTTFHIAGAKKLIGSNIEKKMKRKNISDFNIYDYQEKLSDYEKQLFSKILDFDTETLKKQLKGKDLYLFTTGHIHPKITARWKETPKNMLNILTNARNGRYGNIPKNIVWGYKLHPSLGITDISPIIRKTFPDMIEIPSHIPFEALIVLNLEPKKILGAGSSLFYWLNSNQVLAYISHPYYDDSLKKENIVVESKQIYPHLDKAHFKRNDLIGIIYKNKKDFLVPEYIDGRYCLKEHPFQCGNTTINKNKLIIDWDNNTSSKFQKSADNTYTEI